MLNEKWFRLCSDYGQTYIQRVTPYTPLPLMQMVNGEQQTQLLPSF